jgi:hypothetical protein
MEFEKYLKKYWELKQEVDRLNMIVEHMEDEKYEQKL